METTFSVWLEIYYHDMFIGSKEKTTKIFLWNVCLSIGTQRHLTTKKKTTFVTFPALKCGWAYAIQCIDPSDGKVKVLNLKKKLMEQIMVAAEDLGDPTDPDTGWDVYFQRVKTGPMVFNVEYRLQALKSKPSALTIAQQEACEGLRSMDDVLPRPTPDAQLELLQMITTPNEAPEEISKEFSIQ